MKEDLLHYVWKMKRFDLQGLLTTMGNKVEIVDFGMQNHDAGPDFSNCRIRISDTLWIGNVEMHTKSSQWFAHGHQHDPNYQNVVLHVVYDDDRPVSNSAGQKLPTIILKDRVDQLVLDNYDRFDKSRAWIPCVKMISNVPDIIKATWLDRLVIERLERKTNAVDVLLKSTNYDWEESFFMAMCRNFGLKVNAYPFEVLASSISLKTLLRYKHSHIDIESLLFGQAGMLNDTFQDQYPNKMKTAYRTLRVKHSLDPINPDLWKFMRLRPANFPTIRLAQLAQLIYQTNHLFSKVLAARSIKEVENMLDVKLANYWKNHYRFDQQSINRTKKLGKTTVHLILINTIIPFLFHYGKWSKEERYVDKALNLLRSCLPESNSIIKKWKMLGLDTTSAHATQGLLQLKNEYCTMKKCLHCSIGHSIIKRDERSSF